VGAILPAIIKKSDYDFPSAFGKVPESGDRGFIIPSIIKFSQNSETSE
jgi:hypothetical protein